MRCLAILLARVSVERPDGLALGLFTELLGNPTLPIWHNMHLYVQIEMEQERRGLPVDMRVDLTRLEDDGSRSRSATVHSGTGIVQLPLNPGLPPVFTMNHEIRFDFPEFGIYEVGIYLDNELAAHRLIAIVDSSPKGV